jgi:hypothetical protein
MHFVARFVAPVDFLIGLPDLQAPCSADYESCHSSRVAGARAAQYDNGDPHSCKLSMGILCCIEFCGACIARKRDEVQETCSILQSRCNSKWGRYSFLHTDDVNTSGSWHSYLAHQNERGKQLHVCFRVILTVLYAPKTGCDHDRGGHLMHNQWRNCSHFRLLPACSFL